MKKMPLIAAVVVIMILGTAFFTLYRYFRIDSVDNSEKPSGMERVSEAAGETIAIGFVNKVMPADVWVIENTEKNRKTSVWGTANVKSTELQKEYSATVAKNAEDSYLFRMIDTDHNYYSSDDIILKDGYSIEIFKSAGEFEEIKIAVYDEKGEKTEERDVFNAAL